MSPSLAIAIALAIIVALEAAFLFRSFQVCWLVLLLGILLVGLLHLWSFSTAFSPIATRFGVYFLHSLCSCLRPFSENVRFGVPVIFPLGVPVVSRLRPGGVPVWCRGGVPVVSRRCNGLVSVVSRWCPNGVPVVFRVSVVSRCHIAGPVVSQSCAGRVPVVSRSCCVVSRWCCSVSVVSRWLVPQSCPGGVAVASRGVAVVSSAVRVVGVPVVSRRCPSVVPVVSWSCPVLPGSW